MTNSYRLIDGGSELENHILVRQQERGEWVGRRMDSELMDEVIEDALQPVPEEEVGV